MIIVLLSLLTMLALLSLNIFFISKNKDEIPFLINIFFLFLAQLLFDFPFAGTNLSSIASIFLIVMLLQNVIFSKKIHIKIDIIIAFMLTALLVFNISQASDLGMAIQQFLKVFLFFIVYVYITNYYKNTFNPYMLKVLEVINYIYIFQILLCKLLIGSFSARSYYGYVLEQEFYGFFNSPHPLAAILSLFVILNIFNISTKFGKRSNYILFFMNELLLILLQVRTFILANGVVLLYILCMYVLRRPMKQSIVKPVIILILLAITFVPLFAEVSILDRLANKETTANTEVSSGRYNIWTTDGLYYSKQDMLSMFLGNGMGEVYNINLNFLNRSTYAHNDFLNILLDNGAIGLLLYIVFFLSVYLLNMPKKEHFILYNCTFICFLIAFTFNSVIYYVTFMVLFCILIKMLGAGNSDEKYINTNHHAN